MKNTIQQIKNQVEKLEENLQTFKVNNKGINWSQTISGEITYQDYIDITNFIIIQLRFLMKSHLIFSQITTIDDRSNIYSNLSALSSYYLSVDQGYQYVNVIIKLLQPLSFYVLSRGKFTDDLMVEIGEMLEKKNQLAGEILEFEKLKEQNEKINQDFESKVAEIEEKYNNSNSKIEEIEETYAGLSEKLENAKTESEEITDILTEAKSNKGVIDGFIQQVSSREEQLVNQETKTKNYEYRLKEFQKDTESRITEADRLISEAKELLKLNGAINIGQFFENQHKESTKWWSFIIWLVFSFLFLCGAVIIGWLLLSAESQDLPTVIARISLLPILLTGSYFTANQYVKQKNIAEDYAYKKVLAQSMIGFSDSLLKTENKNKEYSQFVTKVFEQMLQDPLRSRKEKSFELDQKSENFLETLIVKIVSEINKK
jgi:hypothetical protein